MIPELPRARIDCPSDEELAAFVEAGVEPGERRKIEGHLARCSDCRELTAAFARGTAPSASLRVQRRLLVAAALLAAASIAVIVGLRASGPTRASQRLEQRLLAAAEQLQREHPSVLAGFDPLAWRAARAPEDPLRASGPLPRYPRGRILEQRPSFRWDPAGSSGHARLTLTTGRGELLWQIEAVQPVHGFPDDRPDLERGGVYAWTLRGAAEASAQAGLLFEVASEAQHLDFEAALAAIRSSAPADLAPALEACFALGQGFSARAEAAARTSAANFPDEAVARELLARVLDELGERATP